VQLCSARVPQHRVAAVFEDIELHRSRVHQGVTPMGCAAGKLVRLGYGVYGRR